MKTNKSRYNTNDHDKARKYYLLGLTIQEICKLTDVPVRTLQKWQNKEGWVKYKKTDNIKKKTLDLKMKGLSNKQISSILNISTTTIWRYCK